MRVVPSEFGNQCLKSAIWEKFKHVFSLKIYSLNHVLRHLQPWIIFHTDRMASEMPRKLWISFVEFFTFSKLGIFIRHWEYRLLFALGTGPYFGLILNPKRNTEFTVTKAKISHVYLCVSLCRHTSTLKKKNVCSLPTGYFIGQLRFLWHFSDMCQWNSVKSIEVSVSSFMFQWNSVAFHWNFSDLIFVTEFHWNISEISPKITTIFHLTDFQWNFSEFQWNFTDHFQ